MLLERRTLGLLLALILLGVPAAALRVACVGRSCSEASAAPPRVPFCSLPGQVRAGIAAGYRDGRSPDLLAVTSTAGVRGGTGLPSVAPWPSVSSSDAGRVPIVLWGAGVDPGAEIPDGTGLRDVSPTLASVMAFRVPHPEVRSGRPVSGAARGDPPRLVVQVVWAGIGSRDLEASSGRWPALRRLMREGTGTMQGEVGFLPLDPAAALTTLGTGGLPSEHGITGTLVRSGDRVVRAWDRGAPFAVITTLAEDVDHELGQRPRIGLVAGRPTDRGVIAGNWYVRSDRDDVIVEAAGPAALAGAAERLLRLGYGRDGAPDVVAVVLRGSILRLDAALRRVVRAADRVSGGSAAVVVTATGSSGSPGADDVSATELREELQRAVTAGSPVVEGIALGGLFLDQQVLAETGASTEDVLRALRGIRSDQRASLLADAFPGIAVTLSRYC